MFISKIQYKHLNIRRQYKQAKPIRNREQQNSDPNRIYFSSSLVLLFCRAFVPLRSHSTALSHIWFRSLFSIHSIRMLVWFSCLMDFFFSFGIDQRCRQSDFNSNYRIITDDWITSLKHKSRMTTSRQNLYHWDRLEHFLSLTLTIASKSNKIIHWAQDWQINYNNKWISKAPQLCWWQFNCSVLFVMIVFLIITECFYILRTLTSNLRFSILSKAHSDETRSLWTFKIIINTFVDRSMPRDSCPTTTIND